MLRKGISVSPGVCVGTALCIEQKIPQPDLRLLESGEEVAELERLKRAYEATIADLDALEDRVLHQVGKKEAAIFKVHKSILRDPSFMEKIRGWITSERLAASAAVHRLLAEYTALFMQSSEEGIKERLADVRDVVVRLGDHLQPVPKAVEPAFPGPVILVAEELLPSHVVTLGRRALAGIVTQSGGQTSHAAILARSRGVPAVSGVAGILRQVQTGESIIVDGREGHVLIHPDAETESAYRKLEREFFDLKDQLVENRDHPAQSADGEPIELLANVNNLSDMRAALGVGAVGVGLYRTEYLFLTHPDVPDEQEQYAAYRSIIEASPRHTVTIRTLDLGGDKTVPYFGHRREANPFMGWRSIRLSFEHPEFFATQIRALLRAAVDAGAPERVRVLFPMITTVEEMRRVRSMVRRIQKNLRGKDAAVSKVRIGPMLEVPAAAISIDVLLPLVDFVSIGSNDLVQYLMAADRDNPKVTHLCQPLSPPMLRVLTGVIRACNEADKPVTLCGEMAGSPRAFVVLFGMGLRSFSMSPAFIPTIKELATHLTRQRAERIVERAMQLKTTVEVNRFVQAQVADLAPNLKLLASS